MNALRRFWAKIEEVGLWYALYLMVERAIPGFVLEVRSVYLSQLHLAPFLDPTYHDPDIRLAGAAEFERLMHNHPVLAGMREKLGPGVRLWVLFDGADLSAFMWLDTSVIGLTEWVRFQLADDEIAGVFLWVSPERRGTGLGPRINRHISHQYAREGRTRVVSTVDSLNRNSLRADEKVGYERIGKLRAIRILGLCFTSWRGERRLGLWSRRHPITFRVEDVERALRRAP